MKRLPLDERLGPASHEAIVSTLARMSKADFYHGLCSQEAICRFHGELVRIQSALRTADRHPQTMMCDLVRDTARCNFPHAHALLYMLLAHPFYLIQIQKEEALHDNTLRAEGDGIGPVEDDYGGRSVSSP